MSKGNEIYREAIAFEEFILEALEGQVTFHEGGEWFSCDGYSESLLDEPCEVEIKRILTRESFERLYKYSKSIGRKVLLICLSVRGNMVSNESIVIWGSQYVRNLAENRKELWWKFISSFEACPKVVINENRKSLCIEWLPECAKEVGIYPELKLEEIHKLSDINIIDFKNALKKAPNINPSVFIGNGVSIPFGSDLWGKLSDYLFDYLSPKYVDNVELVKSAIGNTTFASTSMSKLMIEQKKYFQALHSCVYRKYETDMHSENTLIRAIVNSKINHQDIELITYNYDEFIEKDYKIVTKKDLSPVWSRRTDRNTKEPKIKHVHGYMKHTARTFIKGIVLTQEEYYRAYTGKSWISEVQKNALDGIGLYVGSSMSDMYQLLMIDEKKRRYDSIKSKRKWKCYALMCFKGLSPRDIVTVYNYYLRKGIYIVFVDDYNKLPTKYDEMMDY